MTQVSSTLISKHFGIFHDFSNKSMFFIVLTDLSNLQASKLIISNQSGSEICHFCNKRVYLMERVNAEGRFFHRGCFRCEYCGTSLRLGNLVYRTTSSNLKFKKQPVSEITYVYAVL